jgi:hypothetical protein
MKKNINYILLFVIAASVLLGACKKTEYTFGKIITPSDVVITTAIQGAATNSTGDGSGIVTITVTAKNALAYKIFVGNSIGDSVLSTTGIATVKYTTLDTNTYTITVNAIGTGGATTTASSQVRVLYEHPIPADIMADLTGGSSKSWMVAKDTLGHFGVGPNSGFYPSYYAAPPNDKASTPCAYSGVITFTQTGPNSISINDNNQGQSFLIAASTGFYGQSGGDGCYVVNAGGTEPLTFGDATSGSDASNSTGQQFTVPGNGLVAFGTGAVTYEILQISPNVIVLRNIGADTNAWYQILRAQ